MNEPRSGVHEESIEAWAAAFAYPPTPDLATPVLRRLQTPQRSPAYRLAWAVLLLVLLGAGLLAVPPLRAAVLDFLEIGRVRIWLAEPTPAPTPAATPAARTTPTPTPVPLASLAELAGETTLAEAQASVGFPILLPAYPPNLGPPHRVYAQTLGDSLLILAWLDPAGAVEMSLTIMGPEAMAEKHAVTLIEETLVNGERALWVRGAHMLQVRSGDYRMMRLVQGNTLIWTQEFAGQALTYRLESQLPVAEAVRVAESLAAEPVWPIEIPVN